MGQVIVITSGKGGSGKSTLTVNCGAALARMGRRTLLVDTDAGLRALDMMLGLSDCVVYDLNNVLTGECEPVKAILETGIPELSLLPAPQTVSNEALDAGEFGRLCRGLSHYYDYVLVDSPAGIGPGVVMAAQDSDRALVVATGDPVCIRDANRMAGVLRGVGLDDIRLVINRVNTRMIRRGVLPDLDRVIDGAMIQLIGVVPEDEQIPVAALAGKTVADAKKGAGAAFRNIAQRIDGRDVPLMKL